jgi:carboxylesterase
MPELPRLLPGAEPQFHRGNEIGVLLVHGFMAAPPEVGWAGTHLAEQGYTVYVPRLTGHGIDHRHMERMRWQDWYGHVLDGYHILRQQCKTVFVMGHSMGGLLSILLAAETPDLAGVIIAASPLLLANRLMPYSRLLAPARPYTEHPSEPELNAEIEAEQARRGEPILSRVHYSTWSTRSVHELYQLTLLANEHLSRLTQPLLLIYAQNDLTVPPKNMQVIRAAVQSTDIEEVTIERGGHIIFQDMDRDVAIRAVGEFIKKRVG